MNLANQLGETPLLFAIEQGRTALCKALLNAGARADAISWGGERASLSAQSNPKNQVVDRQFRLPAKVSPARPQLMLSTGIRLLMLSVAGAIMACGAAVISWPQKACHDWPGGDQGEGNCLSLVAHTGQGSRCRVIEALLYEIKHENSDVVISGALDGLTSTGACSDLAFLRRRIPSTVSRQTYRLVATAFEACIAARPYSENLLARKQSTPTFDEGELRRIANGSPCNESLR